MTKKDLIADLNNHYTKIEESIEDIKGLLRDLDKSKDKLGNIIQTLEDEDLEVESDES